MRHDRAAGRAEPAIVTEGPVAGAIGRIAELHGRYYAASNGFGIGFEAKVARELAAFCQGLQPGRDGMWLVQGAGIEGSVVIDGSHAATDGAHLRWFILSDACRGSGLGRALLQRALAFADACGYASTYLWTFAGLDAARHLYEAHGFALAEEGEGSQWGTVVREQRFVRLLGAATAGRVSFPS